MLLAIPVSASDAKNLPHTAEIFKKFGPYAGFQCAIFARLEIENEHEQKTNLRESIRLSLKELKSI